MNTVSARVWFVGQVVALTGAIAATAYTGIASSQQSPEPGNSAVQSGSRFYAVENLVSDGFVPADNMDPDLVNPWGIAFNPNGFVWVADNGTGLSTLYDGNGVKNSLIVTVPPADNPTAPSAPTGIVFSSGADFIVTSGALSGPSRFIFATEDGTISGWAPNVDPTHAIPAVPHSKSGAIYKGLALAANGSGHLLYATDFHNNRVEVFDSTFQPVQLSGGFVDRAIPRKFAPFGIQNILGNLYVTYAKQDDDAKDDVAGAGLGFVDVFDADGHLIRRLAAGGKLNAPWGLALAPANFGRFSNMLLVGNFGDGRISAYDPDTLAFRGQLRTADGAPITIDGLWGISFGNGLLSQPISTLFFTAGSGDEEHGLYGRIDALAAQSPGDFGF